MAGPGFAGKPMLIYEPEMQPAEDRKKKPKLSAQWRDKGLVTQP